MAYSVSSRLSKLDLSVKISRLKLRTPLLVASGTFTYQAHCRRLFPLEYIGAIVTKSISLRPRKGNPPPRTVETACGLINSVGLENPGIELFVKERLPLLRSLGAPIIVSLWGEDEAEFIELVERLSSLDNLEAIELNLSCPNLKNKGTLISQDEKKTYRVIKAVRKRSSLVIISKLSPNVTDILPIARAAKNAGTDAISLTNTFLAISVDIYHKRPHLANVVGGLSGPAIKPLSLYLVWRVAKNLDLQVIGMGGIMSWEDAVEFFLVGARAVALGTANLVDPQISKKIIQGLRKYLLSQGLYSLKELTGRIK